MTEENVIPTDRVATTPDPRLVARLAKSLLQLNDVVKAVRGWEASTLALTGHLEPQLAHDAVRDARKATVRHHDGTSAVSLMWPRIIKRDAAGQLRNVKADTDDSVYQVLEVLIDGSDAVRVSITDSVAAVKCPLYMAYVPVSEFVLAQVLNRFYELVPTAVPGPGSIYGENASQTESTEATAHAESTEAPTVPTGT